MNALVTGTSRGIGLELVKQLAERGANVWAIARNPQDSPELVRLSQVFPVHLIALDLRDPELSATLKTALDRVGSLDLLINNAGLGEAKSATLPNLDMEQVRTMFEINTLAAMRVTQACLPYLLKANAPKVANMSSLMGSIEDNKGGGAYCYRMSKAALNMFTKCLAIEQTQVVSVVLHPGWVKTRMGGPGAPVERDQSARGLLEVIDGLTPQHSGGFFDYRGVSLPW